MLPIATATCPVRISISVTLKFTRDVGDDHTCNPGLCSV